MPVGPRDYSLRHQLPKAPSKPAGPRALKPSAPATSQGGVTEDGQGSGGAQQEFASSTPPSKAMPDGASAPSLRRQERVKPRRSDESQKDTLIQTLTDSSHPTQRAPIEASSPRSLSELPKIQPRRRREEALQTQARTFPSMSELLNDLTSAKIMRRFKGPTLPTKQEEPSVNLMVPREALAQLLGILAESKRTPPELVQLSQRAETLFLNGRVGPKEVIPLLMEADKILDGLENDSLWERCQHLLDASIKDTTKVYISASRSLAVQKRQESPKSQSYVVMNEIEADLKKVGKSLERIREPGLAMETLGTALRDLAQKVDAQGEDRLTALEILRDRSLTLETRIDDLGFLQKNSVSQPPIPKDLAAIGQARSLLMESQATPKAYEALKDEDFAAIARLFEQGSSMDEVGNRLVAVFELRRLITAMSDEEKQSLGVGIMFSQDASSWAPTLTEGDYIARQLGQLSVDERRDISNLLQQGTPLAAAFSAMSLVPGKRLRGGVLGADQREMIAKEVKQFVAYKKAKATVEATNVLTQGSALSQLADNLRASASRLLPTTASENDNLSARAFETLLVKELIARPPLSTLRTWQKLGEHMASISEELYGSPDRQKVAEEMVKYLSNRGVRPWDGSSNEIGVLARMIENQQKPEIVLNMVEAILATPVLTGHHILLRANLVRDLWLAMGSVGKAPNMKATNEFYSKIMSRQTGRQARLYGDVHQALVEKGLDTSSSGPVAPRTATGIMALHQPQPGNTRGIEAASLPSLQYFIDIENPSVENFVAKGAVTAAGVSGSTNIILAVFEDALRDMPQEKLAVRDALLGAAQFLVHDGGHSFHEILWVGDHAFDGRFSSEVQGVEPQSLAQFKQMFSDSAEVQSAFRKAGQGLVEYRKELDALAGQSVLEDPPK